jgi:uncharacterized protein (TIGR00730 family)
VARTFGVSGAIQRPLSRGVCGNVKLPVACDAVLTVHGFLVESGQGPFDKAPSKGVTFAGYNPLMKSLCVFCGSSPGSRPEYAALAVRTGELIAQRGLTLVYGGGRVGLMGALADAALAAGGRVVGVIPQMLIDREVGHAGLSQLHVVRTMSERKLLMGDLSDAFLALPGGIGTMDELFEAWTWTQLGLHRKPCALLNQDGYYDPLLEFLDRAVEEGFLQPRYRAALFVAADVESALDQLSSAVS